MNKLNEKRLHLIEKKFSVGLTQDEDAELDQLQDKAAAWVDLLHPLPFDRLAELEQELQ